jgi:hypothetical protein
VGFFIVTIFIVMKNLIKKLLRENLESNNNIKDILIKRIPFLKEYNIFKHSRDEKRLEAQRIVNNENVTMIMGDKIIKFPQLNISSEIYYYENKVYDNTFHNFGVKNKIHANRPKEMDDLTYRVFIIAMKGLNETLSYNKEIMVKNNEEIPKNELDKIINDMNGTLFKIEEFTQKHNIDLF